MRLLLGAALIGLVIYFLLRGLLDPLKIELKPVRCSSGVCLTNINLTNDQDKLLKGELCVKVLAHVKTVSNMGARGGTHLRLIKHQTSTVKIESQKTSKLTIRFNDTGIPPSHYIFQTKFYNFDEKSAC